MPHDADEKVRKYRVAVQSCATAAWMVGTHDLPELLAAIEKAETLGPIVDPTLYSEKIEAMEQDKELLKAAMPLWTLARKRIESGKKGEAASGG